MTKNSFEQFYKKPERQGDLVTLLNLVKKELINKRVLEIGCGSGFWTEQISEVATFVHSIDKDNSLLKSAKNKLGLKKNIKFENINLFELDEAPIGSYIFVAFLWSKFRVQDLDIFLQKIYNIGLNQSTIIFIDNNYIENSNYQIVHIDSCGNTYNRKNLNENEAKLYLKNYPSSNFIEKKLQRFENLASLDLTYYWLRIVRPKM